MFLFKNGNDIVYISDGNGNTTTITRGSASVTYEYNGANELVRENNAFTNQTVTYTYDLWGNLTEKNVYAYTTATDPGTPTDTITYGYTNTGWGDQLTSYGAETISYEEVYNNQQVLIGYAGTPHIYRGKTMTWYGNQLTGISDTLNNLSAAYVYDSNGLRQKKTVNNVDTDYYYNGSVLIGLTKGTDTLRFSYDAAGNAAAVDHNGTYYYYLRNGQGDIVKIVDGSGTTVVEYSYDSWGKQLSCTGTLATTLGALNPFRYRGYVYDEETGFYYLKSRYYDPETCRFISADVLLSTGQGVIGHNTYAYCRNNPISRRDIIGLDDEEIEDVTESLNALMEEHANELKEYLKTLIKVASIPGSPFTVSAAYFSTMGYFIQKVNDYGAWDLKRSTEKYSKDKVMIYDGKVYTGEQIGNIHFGYVGRAIFSSWFLHFGAGLNQLSKGYVKENRSYFFDEPDDYDMIEYGIKLYEESH